MEKELELKKNKRKEFLEISKKFFNEYGRKLNSTNGRKLKKEIYLEDFKKEWSIDVRVLTTEGVQKAYYRPECNQFTIQGFGLFDKYSKDCPLLSDKFLDNISFKIFDSFVKEEYPKLFQNASKQKQDEIDIQGLRFIIDGWDFPGLYTSNESSALVHKLLLSKYKNRFTWRLPKPEELDLMYKNKNLIEHLFCDNSEHSYPIYWTSDGDGIGSSLCKNFNTGRNYVTNSIFDRCRVRLVRNREHNE